MNTIQTSDFNLTATLLYLGYSIEALDRKDPQRIEFHFPNDPTLISIIEAFYKGELKVEPKRYFACIREIRNRIHSGI